MFGISVIIPCFNSAAFVAECVKSIRVGCPHEIIVVDDGSSDAQTCLALAEISESGAATVIRHDTKQGSQRSRNHAIMAARYSFILPLDSDDLLAECRYVDCAVEALSKQPNFAFAHCGIRLFGDVCGFSTANYPLDFTMVAKRHHVPTSIIYRRDDAIRCGGYDVGVQRWQDWAFAMSLLHGRHCAGLRNEVWFHPFASHMYRIHAGVDRITFRAVVEKDVISDTVLTCRSSFEHIYGARTVPALIDAVVANRPNRLSALGHVAAFDPGLAIRLLYERKHSFICRHAGVPDQL